MYNKMGKPLPQGWALGANGQESTDAPDVLANIVAKKGAESCHLAVIKR